MKFWKIALHLLSNKAKSKEKITLVENNETISDNAEIAKILKNYSDKKVGNLDINRNLECILESFKEDPVLASVKKYATPSSIKNIKRTMNGSDSNFRFTFFDQDQVFKEIKKLDRNKTSQKLISQSKL